MMSGIPDSTVLTGPSFEYLAVLAGGGELAA
jgi:hypothetical protein